MEVDRLEFWPENPRWLPAEGEAALRRSMLEDPEMLRAKPLLVLPDATVLWGNQRLLVGRKLGLKTLPGRTVSGLTRTQEKTWALRDNASYGAWDPRPLGEMLAELESEGVELVLTGLTSADLDRYLAPFVAPTDPDAAPGLPDGEPESRRGELYRLGKHCLLCADSTQSEIVAGLLGTERAEVLLTDPPYGVDYVGKTDRRLRISNDDADGLPGLLADVFDAVDGVLAPSARFYVASPVGPRGTVFRAALDQVGWQFHQELVWVKNSPVLGHSDYLIQHEAFLYGWKPGPGRAGRGRHKGSRWYGDNRQTSVLFFDRPARSDAHPTIKPVALLEAMLRNSSRRGDIVLDPFAGSGSTLIACERLDRRCFAIEIDPAYCDVIRRRYREFIGDGDDG